MFDRVFWPGHDVLPKDAKVVLGLTLIKDGITQDHTCLINELFVVSAMNRSGKFSTFSVIEPTGVPVTGGLPIFLDFFLQFIIIDREAGEIMRLVASVCLFLCLRVCGYVRALLFEPFVHLKGHSKWLGVQNGCCFDRFFN